MNDYRELHELYHFGTDGMKWGRRRYQNEDGSYKPGAEGRYYDEVGHKQSRKEKRNSDILNSASEKAKLFEGYAKENSSKFGKNRRTKVEHEASNKQAEYYKQLSKKYSDALKDPKHADRKTLREAKKFAKKGIFEDADYTIDYDPKTGKKFSYLDTEAEKNPNRVKKFISSHKKEIAIGAAAATALIAGAAIYKYKKGAASRAAKDISDEYKRITTKQSPIKAADVAKTVVKETTTKAPDFKVTPNTTKAAAEAARKASDTVNYANATKKVTNNYDNLKRAAADLNKRADQNLKDGEDFIQQMLKENEELLKKYRNGGDIYERL